MIGIAGAGAFGTALAIALARDGRTVTLWARNPDRASPLPENIALTDDIGRLRGSDAILLAVPMQALAGFLAQNAAHLDAAPLVTCCKGVDLQTLQGATALIRQACPGATTAVLTGPGFAVDIANGLPTALTLACESDAGEELQKLLSTATLRLYRSTDVVGAELGGALKNVIAIAAGCVMGAGLGCSARAALMTRGYAEMSRLALRLGARAETLAGLSGLGDLVLTCTSPQSRNLRYGMALGSGTDFDGSVTVEGAATALAVARLADRLEVDMPISKMVAALVDKTLPLDRVIRSLMSRPLKEE